MMMKWFSTIQIRAQREKCDGFKVMSEGRLMFMRNLREREYHKRVIRHRFCVNPNIRHETFIEWLVMDSISWIHVL